MNSLDNIETNVADFLFQKKNSAIKVDNNNFIKLLIVDNYFVVVFNQTIIMSYDANDSGLDLEHIGKAIVYVAKSKYFCELIHAVNNYNKLSGTLLKGNNNIELQVYTTPKNVDGVQFIFSDRDIDFDVMLGKINGVNFYAIRVEKEVKYFNLSVASISDLVTLF